MIVPNLTDVCSSRYRASLGNAGACGGITLRSPCRDKATDELVTVVRPFVPSLGIDIIDNNPLYTPSAGGTQLVRDRGVGCMHAGR